MSNERRQSRAIRWASVLLALGLALQPCAGAETAAEPTVRAVVRYTVDFDYLREAAPNAVAWLYQPSGAINQPIMYDPEDPEHYLRRQFLERISPNGSIFMTGESEPNFTDKVITLYGRNCLDCTMFGSLSEYKSEEYYTAHPFFYLITPEAEYRLDVFAGIRTKLTDDTSWLVPQGELSELMTTDLPAILERSYLTPKASALPVEGDSWVVMATKSPENNGNRYVIYARKRRIEYITDKVGYVNQSDMDRQATLTKRVAVEGVGEWLLYAQNDPLWKTLIFEYPNSKKRRPFGDGGCGPTAVAIAIANLVDKEELGKIRDYALSPYGYRFCVDSINESWCSGRHLPYQITSADEYLRYFPLVVANFATGNNIWEVIGRAQGFGTNMNYLSNICEVYDLVITRSNKMAETIEFIRENKTVAIACTGGYDSPFTNNSHFIVLVGADDEYLYILDPYQRESYKSVDAKEYLEVIEPGFVRVKLENAGKCCIAPIYLLQRAEDVKPAATEAPEPTNEEPDAEQVEQTVDIAP